MKTRLVKFGMVEALSRVMSWGSALLLGLFLDPSVFGKTAVYMSLLIVIPAILVFGQDQSMLRFANDETLRLKHNLFPVFVIWFITSAVVGAMLMSGMAFTTGDTFLGVSITPDWILVYVLCVLEALLGVLGSLIRASGSAREFAVHRTVGIIRIAVMAGLVAWLDDPFYYLLGGIWTAAIYLVPFVRKGLAHAKLAENRRSFLSATKALLVFGWPFVPVMLSLRLLAFSDRLFLQHYHSLDEVGRYTLGYVLGSSLGFFYAVVGADFEPSLYTHTSGSEQKGRMLLERYIESLCIIGLVAAAALCSILYVLDTHLGVEKLRNVGGIVTPVLAAHIINVVYLKSHFLLTLRKLPRSIAVVTVGSGIAIVVANFLLIPPLGGRGAALATLVGFAVLALFLHLRSLQEWRFMPFDHFVTGFVIALSCIATLAGESLLTAATLYFVCAVGLTSYSVTREGGTVMVAFSSLAQKIPVPLRLRR